MIGQRHLGLAKLQDYLKKTPFQPVKSTKHKWITLYNGPGGVDIDGLDSWDKYDLDLLELNNLMASLRSKQIRDDAWNPSNKDFSDYLGACKDVGRAEAIKAMMMNSAVKWGGFSSKEFAKVAANQSKGLFLAYERAEHLWKGIEMISEVKGLWTDFTELLKKHQVIPWVDKAGWKLDITKQVVLEEDQALHYLAPLQRNLAEQESVKTQKEMVSKMNRIMMDSMAVAGMSMEGKEVLPEEVMAPLKQLMLVSGSYIQMFYGTLR